MKIRTFVAVDIDPEITDPVRRWQKRLQDEFSSKFRWVDPGKFHITLSFLGDVQRSRVNAIIDSLQKAVEDIPPFDITPESAGAFPNPGYPKVLWVGIGAGNQKLCRLQERVAAVLQQKHGFEPERRDYHPHITIARGQRSGRLPDLSALIGEVEGRQWGTQRVQQVEVFKSDLQAGGPVYTSLASPSLALAGEEN